VFEDQRVFDVIVQGDPAIAKDPEAVRNLLIDRPDGGHVRLNQIADVREGSSPTVIKRDEVSRKLDITLDVSGRGVEAVADDLEDALRDVDMPLEYHAKVIDETVADEINQRQAFAFAIAAALLVLLLLQAAVRSWRLAVLAWLTLPSALLGGLVGMLLLGDGLTVATGAGLLAVLVLAARNAVTTLDASARADDSADRAVARFGPVVTSSVAIAAAMLPFAVLGSRVGLEILQPMAVVVIGGLVTTVTHALFVVPALAMAAPPGPDEDEEILQPAGAESASTDEG
jgi:Cu/Ag efflux pump CusA